MSDRVAVVTGANRGIGRAGAEGIARAGFRTVLVCRREADAQAAAREIAERTGNPAVEYVLGDLASRGDVRSVAEELRARHPAIHVLVNNAAVASRERRTSPDGLELTFAVNHLAYFELTLRLLPALRAAATSRVVNVSSEAHQSAVIDFDDLQNARRYGGVAAYGRSKLMNLLFTRELARRLDGSPVRVNAMHPGVIATRLLVDYMPVLRPLAKLVGGRPEDGADTMIWLAASPDAAAAHGQYFINRREAKPSRRALDADAALRLWRTSAELAGLPAEGLPG